jgi:hypothetical protein
MSRLRSCKEGKEDERDKRKVRQDSTGQCGADDRAKHPGRNHVLSCVSSSAVLVRVSHPSLVLAACNCGWSWKEAIGRTTKNWAGPMLLLESFAMPSSPLAFALPELGRHLINLCLAFTILSKPTHVCMDHTTCKKSCWLKCMQ